MTDAVRGSASGGWSPERSAAGGHNPYLIAFVVSIATFMEVLDTTIANVALRYIAGSLAVGIDESTYVITSYLVANAIVLSISGWLSTVIGRKRFYMICVATFALASLLCGFAWSLEALVLFRIPQGLGGGAAWRPASRRSSPIHSRPRSADRPLRSMASQWSLRRSWDQRLAAGSAIPIPGTGCF
jgi:MFS transporter, DHA2 family, multidrug resistance protein